MTAVSVLDRIRTASRFAVHDRLRSTDGPPKLVFPYHAFPQWLLRIERAESERQIRRLPAVDGRDRHDHEAEQADRLRQSGARVSKGMVAGDVCGAGLKACATSGLKVCTTYD